MASSASVAVWVTEIEEWLDGVPVYTLTNGTPGVHALVVHPRGRRGGARLLPTLGLLSFRKEDVDALL
jgi:hypothetical protein